MNYKTYFEECFEKLTVREKETFRYKMKGLHENEIAKEMSIKLPTVKYHTTHILTKFKYDRFMHLICDLYRTVLKREGITIDWIEEPLDIKEDEKTPSWAINMPIPKEGRVDISSILKNEKGFYVIKEKWDEKITYYGPFLYISQTKEFLENLGCYTHISKDHYGIHILNKDLERNEEHLIIHSLENFLENCLHEETPEKKRTQMARLVFVNELTIKSEWGYLAEKYPDVMFKIYRKKEGKNHVNNN